MSDQKVEYYVHLLVAESWVIGGGDRLFYLVLRETSSGMFERIGVVPVSVLLRD